MSIISIQKKQIKIKYFLFQFIQLQHVVKSARLSWYVRFDIIIKGSRYISNKGFFISYILYIYGLNRIGRWIVWIVFCVRFVSVLYILKGHKVLVRILFILYLFLPITSLIVLCPFQIEKRNDYKKSKIKNRISKGTRTHSQPPKSLNLSPPLTYKTSLNPLKTKTDTKGTRKGHPLIHSGHPPH